jgi:hypothetical protein
MSDIKLQPLAVTVSGHSPETIKKDGIHFFLINRLQPHSRATTHLASTDARANANVDLAFLTNHKDFVALVKVVKFSMHVVNDVKDNGYTIEPCDAPKDDSNNAMDDFIGNHRGRHTMIH